ncbi:cytochrome c oxidase assembly protein [Paucisalibacillus sp. EB02]|uniref:cytochrome c oxidase assembly protein n=1 Tax=Paucisalibacillus sp. EB02 TaxID=1347087 RepID=UPI0004B348BD|nr:cytochrome c oxidase assembly protein [Paucisalibacillus sp. EB02]
MNTHHHLPEAIHFLEKLMAIPFIVGFIGYLLAVYYSNRKFKKWPFYRIIFFTLGILCALLSITGPLAKLAHQDFSIHMITHLFLGMLAPLLLLLGAPMTIFLRSISTHNARKVTTLLKSKPIQFMHQPIIASVLNMGGLWLLYTTSLYSSMHENALLYLLIHVHVFLASYLFTMSMIYIEPTLQRHTYMYRSIILVIALAAHAILAKYIYAFPPKGVPQPEAELGGMLMYYGGDAIDLIIIIILCHQWYKASRPRIRKSTDYSHSNQTSDIL